MSGPNIDLLSSLHSASAEVDDLCRKARKVQHQAERLESPQRDSMPVFSGQWSKAALSAHIEMLQEWITAPVRARNRQFLQRVGVETQGLPEELFDDSERLEAIVKQVHALTERFEPLKQILLSDKALVTWLRTGIEETQSHLTEIENNLPRYERLRSSSSPEPLKHYLIALAVSRPNQASDAERIAGQAERVSAFGIDFPGGEEVEDWEAMCGVLSSLCDLIENLTENFPEESTSLQKAVSGQSIQQAMEIIDERVRRCEGERTDLITQWHELRNSLALLGNDAEDGPPQTLVLLRRTVERLRRECISKLGTDGMALLGFLREEQAFPNDLSIESIERALISLRPLILRALKEEVHDA